MAKISSNVFGAIIALVISITLYFGYDLVMDEIQSYPRVGCRIEKFICPNNLIPGVELNCTLVCAESRLLTPFLAGSLIALLFGICIHNLKLF